jgi:hypothetical protein
VKGIWATAVKDTGKIGHEEYFTQYVEGFDGFCRTGHVPHYWVHEERG